MKNEHIKYILFTVRVSDNFQFGEIITIFFYDKHEIGSKKCLGYVQNKNCKKW